MFLIRLMKNILCRFGIIVFKKSSRVYLPDADACKIVAELIGRCDPVIIDGGAHRGDAVREFSRFFSKAEFHCFEPDPTLGEELSRVFAGDPTVHVVKEALGDKCGLSSFNINSARPTNSLLETSRVLDPDLQQLCRLVEKVEVAVTTIDDYRALHKLDRIDVIKLDLQGYDYNALVGARKTLPETRVVLAEVFFTEVYVGGHLFQDILQLMIDSGFRLFTLCGLHYGEDHRLLWADAIFINNRAIEGSEASPVL